MGKSAGRKKKSNHPNSKPESDPTPPASSPLPPHSNGSIAAAAEQSLPAYLKRAHELKEEGNHLFQSKDYPSALKIYAAALSLLPRSHPERAVFHSNRAACLMQMRPVDHEAVAAECTLALDAQPNFPRALLRRARALESLRRFDLALQDVHSLLSLDPSNPDALDLARRLRDHLRPHPPPSPAALGASAVRGAPIAGLGPCLPSRPIPKKPISPPPPPLFEKPEKAPLLAQPSSLPNGAAMREKPAEVKPVAAAVKWRPLKLIYDHDIRLAQMPAGCGFRALRDIVATRFPSSKAVLIKYKDEDGDLVTVTSSAELRLAEECADKGKDGTIGVLRLHVVEVSEDQEPQAEDEGSVEVDEPVSEVIKTGPEEPVVNPLSEEKDGKKECGHAECKEVEIDDWLYDFAQLFRQQVGIDPDAHLDLHELGMELCSEAVEETVTSEDAQGLFEMAAAKFQEVAALAFFNWGNVHMCAARKKIPLDESAPKEVLGAQLRVAYDWVRERYALAGEKYEEALRIKPDFYEGLLALGQQHFESAKLHWSFALANKVDLTAWDSSETIMLFDSAEEKMRYATEMWEKVEEQRMNELKDPSLNKKEEILKKRKKGTGADGHGELSAEEAAEQAAVMRSQIHLFWGNMLFERSQVEFKLGVGNWKKNLDTAVDRFKLAGASEVDISVVLKNHGSNGGGSGAGVEGDEKKVTSVNNHASETKANDEDKHVLEN